MVGGPAQTRSLAEVDITKIAVGPYNNNAYLVRCLQTGEALLIDAAAEPDRLLDLLKTTSLEPEAPLSILTTHGHADHWQALADVVEATGARTYAGRFDADDIPVATDVLVEDDDVITVGTVSLRAIHLVGHTQGSIALAYQDPVGTTHIFTGDCLFPGGIGKTWDDPQRFEQLLTGVTTRIFDRFGDDTWIYPGHGADTTLGEQRPELAEWRARGW